MGLVQLMHADRDDGWEAFSRFQPHRYQVAKLVSGNADVINSSAWFGPRRDADALLYAHDHSGNFCQQLN